MALPRHFRIGILDRRHHALDARGNHGIGARRRLADMRTGLERHIEGRTARGLAGIEQILASATRVKRVAFGAGDFTLDLNMQWSRSEAELAYARARIVTASRAGGIEAPLDTVWVDLQDAEGLEASTRAALACGYQGKMCIHPNQIPVVNRVFTPSAAEIAFAERVVDAFARAEAEGSAAIQVDGKFIDYPIVYRAQRLLEKVAALRAREGQ